MLDIRKRTLYKQILCISSVIDNTYQSAYIHKTVHDHRKRVWANKIEASVQLSDNAMLRSQMSEILYLNKNMGH